MAGVTKDTLATLPGPRTPGEVPPEHDADAEHAQHPATAWQLLAVYTPEQDYELDPTTHKAVARGSVTAPVAKYICTAATTLGGTCGVVKEEPWEG